MRIGVSSGRGGSGRAASALATAAAAVLAALLVSGSALASPAPSRQEYVAKLEGICKPRALATERVMKGARSELNAERFAVVARKFDRASALFGETVSRMAPVPRPPADRTVVRRWFGYLNRQAEYLRAITAQLRAHRAVPAQRLTARFIHNGNLANNVVIAFGFDYCSFKFSRYG